jgi:flavin reductase (DIM6/NTAB) family NADH-FMN oxidoreductase RutF
VTVTDRPLLDPSLYRGLFRRHAAGVAVITTRDGDRPVGFTATSLVALALDPPLLSFNLSRTSSSWSAVERAEHVAVHLLGEHQADVAATFARSGADRFAAPTRWDLGPYAVPVLDDVLAWMVCRVETRVDAGDHAVVIGQVLEADYHPAHRPLIYHDGGFTRLPA